MKYENLKTKSIISILTSLDSCYLNLFASFLRANFSFEEAHNKAREDVLAINKEHPGHVAAEFFEGKVVYQNGRNHIHVIITENSIEFFSDVTKAEKRGYDSYIEHHNKK